MREVWKIQVAPDIKYADCNECAKYTKYEKYEKFSDLFKLSPAESFLERQKYLFDDSDALSDRTTISEIINLKNIKELREFIQTPKHTKIFNTLKKEKVEFKDMTSMKIILTEENFDEIINKVYLKLFFQQFIEKMNGLIIMPEYDKNILRANLFFAGNIDLSYPLMYLDNPTENLTLENFNFKNYEDPNSFNPVAFDINFRLSREINLRNKHECLRTVKFLITSIIASSERSVSLRRSLEYVDVQYFKEYHRVIDEVGIEKRYQDLSYLIDLYNRYFHSRTTEKIDIYNKFEISKKLNNQENHRIVVLSYDFRIYIENIKIINTEKFSNLLFETRNQTRRKITSYFNSCLKKALENNLQNKIINLHLRLNDKINSKYKRIELWPIQIRRAKSILSCLEEDS